MTVADGWRRQHFEEAKVAASGGFADLARRSRRDDDGNPALTRELETALEKMRAAVPDLRGRRPLV